MYIGDKKFRLPDGTETVLQEGDIILLRDGCLVPLRGETRMLLVDGDAVYSEHRVAEIPVNVTWTRGEKSFATESLPHHLNRELTSCGLKVNAVVDGQDIDFSVVKL